MLKPVMVRIPPGDRWGSVDNPESVLVENLTAALAMIARTYKVKEFIVNAKNGEILIEDGKKEPTKDYVSSLYEEDI